ncbi:transposase [Hymenobacter sp.]|jgi:hypothetical protein|uniref:transposase n=1 Tax=Hymenobacter sp. TaxID=1898978 RepID=UPI002EDBAD63
MRRSLKGQRNAPAFAAGQQPLADPQAAEARGDLVLYYADEVRFSRSAPVPYAWQVRGQPPVLLPAERGPHGGYSVWGLWRPGGPQGQHFLGWMAETAFTAELVVGALDEFSQQLNEPTILVLDNASVHRAALVQGRRETGAARGLTLLFLPPIRPNSTALKSSGAFASTIGSRPLPTHPPIRISLYAAPTGRRADSQYRHRTLHDYFCMST